jgi:intracellular multiplication protein IcmK
VLNSDGSSLNATLGSAMYYHRYDKKRTLLTTLLCAIMACVMLTTVKAQNVDNNSLTPQQLKKLSTLLQKNPQAQQKTTMTEQGGQDTQTMASGEQIKNNGMPFPTANEANGTASDETQMEDDYWSSYHDDQNKEIFQAVKQSAFALTPEQIEEMHDMLDDTQRAVASEPYRSPPSPTSSSLLVNLSPGSVPPVIRLARGFVSSLVFIDSTGSPWPIQAYDLGNPKAFSVKWNQKDNTIMIQAKSGYTYGNIAVILQGLETPVMLTLVPGQKVVDYRVDLRVQGMGPNAKLDTIKAQGLPGISSPALLSILDGVPPQISKRLMVSGGGAEAWLVDDKIFLRSRYTVISPAWFAKLSSADGMSAYELPITPVVLLSHYGKAVPIRITGF